MLDETGRVIIYQEKDRKLEYDWDSNFYLLTVGNREAKIPMSKTHGWFCDCRTKDAVKIVTEKLGSVDGLEEFLNHAMNADRVRKREVYEYARHAKT